jgi:2-methylcitrate dehydratase
MDKPLEALSAYAAGLTYGELPEQALHGMRRCLVDSFACAAGGLHNEPVDIARALSRQSTGSPPASIWFTGEPTTPEMAAYTNALMVRYLDCNDTFRVREGGHPSDAISAVFALAETTHASGRDTMLALVTTYEVFAALSAMEDLGPHGIDHSLHVAVAAAAGTAKMMGLNEEQTANAISLTLTANVCLRVAREGRLSMWKGGAGPNGTRNGVFAAQLAALGMTGPEEPFLGSSSMRVVLGEEPTVPPLGGRDQHFHTDKTNFKFFPAELHGQAPIWAALELREKVAPEDIEALSVHTYRFAYTEIGSGEDRWNVKDRETADHSLPFLLATSLLAGGLKPEQFELDRIMDPAVQGLISRISVHEDPALTANYPGVIATRLEATDRQGRQHMVALEHPKGNVKNPLTDAEVEQKFHQFAAETLSPDAQAKVLDALWHFEEAKDVADVLAALRG